MSQLIFVDGCLVTTFPYSGHLRRPSQEDNGAAEDHMSTIKGYISRRLSQEESGAGGLTVPRGRRTRGAAGRRNVT
jgi:hypothetical protein